jgi:hypothetical protein
MSPIGEKETDCTPPGPESTLSTSRSVDWHSKVAGEGTGGSVALPSASAAASAATFVSAAAFEIPPQVSHKVVILQCEHMVWLGLVGTVPSDTWFSLDGCLSSAEFTYLVY